MTQLSVPEHGLKLLELLDHPPASDDGNAKLKAVPAQAMLLELDDNVLHEILRSARHGGKGVNLAFGKSITLHYGNKSLPLTQSSLPSNNQLYTQSTEKESELAFAGQISHKLAMQKAWDEVAGADEALEKLQSQLKGYKKEKESNKIKLLPNSSAFPPASKKAAAALNQSSIKKSSLASLQKNTTPSKSSNNIARSLPASPAIDAARSSDLNKQASTSAPSLANGKVQRLQMLREPLVHFLAARPASTNLLTKHLACQEDELLEVLQKIGKVWERDPSKWTLSDRAYKELNIWDFKYPDEEDRFLVRDKAIAAFDKMRISVKDPIWDKLLPKHERGKGKILSHLHHLHNGPIQKSSTPRIHVEHPSMDVKGDRAPGLDGNDSERKDRLGPGEVEPSGGSNKNPMAKRKTKPSDKEARSSRLLSKGPKKAAPASKEKESHPTIKKGVKKTNAPKSSEFVSESDEEDGLEDAATLQAQSAEHKDAGNPKTLKPQKTSKSAVSTPKAKTFKASETAQSNTAMPDTYKATAKPAKKSQNVISTKFAVAAISDNELHDTETKELIEKKKPMLLAKAVEKTHLPPATSAASSPAPKHRTSDTSQTSTTMTKSLSRQRTTSSPHKPSPLGSSPPTNASDFDNTTHSSSTSSTPLVRKNNTTPNGAAVVNGHSRNASEQPLKRKADDLDSLTHDQATPSSANSSRINGHVNGSTSSSSKRQKTSEMTPPTSEDGDSPLARDVALQKALDFKKYYARYEKQYREVCEMDSPPRERIDDLMKMHNRLAEMKDQITKGLIGI